MCSLQRRGDVFILTITGDDEHRLNPTLIDSIRAALRRAKSESTSSTALITTSEGKFFSNGFDVPWALSDPDTFWAKAKIMTDKLRLLAEDLICLPMPTIAAVTGHAAAAGCILALCHDYILMREDQGYLYMNELEIKYTIPYSALQILKSKIGSPKNLKYMVLKALKIDSRTGLEWGIVDSTHADAAETVGAAVKLAADLVGRKWDGESYAANRRSVLAEVLAALKSDETVVGSGGNAGNVASRL